MSGHSKWDTIKRKKQKKDRRRGKLFSKLIKEITVAARMGGGDPETNPRLRTAIDNAKAENMPNDNIDRAIKRGTGELPGVDYEEVFYEGYGHGGIAIYIKAQTDNKNRTVAELRHLLDKYGGSMADAGSVAWMFERKGLITVNESEVDEDTLFEVALESGAEDMSNEDGIYEIITDPSDFEDVKTAINDREIKYESADITQLPQSMVNLDEDKTKKAMKLIESIEDHDDVQNVYTNLDIPPHLIDEEE